MGRVRAPAVAGYFYESSREKLIEQIEWCIKHPLGPGGLVKEPRGDFKGVPIIVVPHAGYVYSGPIAALSYAEIYRFHEPRVFVIVGPSHYGIGAPVAIYPGDAWETPLGTVEIDRDIVNALRRKVHFLELDTYAFEREHSLEVQVPFIQYMFPGARIVPIALWRQTLEVARDLGKAIADLMLNSTLGSIVLVASSDWNHYEHHEITTEKDMRVIDKVLRLDEEGFYESLSRYEVSACGYGAVATAIVAGKELKVREVRLLRHATSGDTGGYMLETVGYASIGFYL
jgi:hypothetical protein